MRRLLALLVNLAMLHLLLLGGDFACASHGPMSGEAMAGMGSHSVAMEGMAHQAASPAATTGVQGATHCDTPVQQRCCETASGCSLSVTVAAAERATGYDAPRGTTPVLARADHQSVRVAPEPPPPRA